MRFLLIILALCCFVLSSQPSTNSQTIVKGRVLDSQEAPISNAVLEFRISQALAGDSLQDQDFTVVQVKTNQDGCFAVTLPKWGIYDVFVSHPVYAPQSEKIRLSSRKHSLNFSLKISKVVVDEYGDIDVAK